MDAVVVYLGHRAEQFHRRPVALRQHLEHQLMLEIIHALVLFLPELQYHLAPGLQEECSLAGVDEAVLDIAVVAADALATAVDEEIAILYEFRDRVRHEGRGVQPVAAVLVEQLHAADIGEVGVFHLARPELVHDDLRERYPVEDALFVQHHEFLRAVLPDACEAVLYEQGSVFLALEPDGEDAFRFSLADSRVLEMVGRGEIVPAEIVRDHAPENVRPPGAAPFGTPPERIQDMSADYEPRRYPETFQSHSCLHSLQIY